MSLHHRARSIVISLVVAIAIGTSHGNGGRRRVPSAFAQLAVLGGHRIVEPRLSLAFPYARFRLVGERQRFDAVTREEPRLMSVARALFRTPEGNLLLGRWTEALELFERADTTPDPVDVAATYYMRGIATDSLSDFGRALEALRNAGDSAEATFNRALILEQLSDLTAASSEWQRYLEKDADSEWAAEARRHLAAARRPSAPEAWNRAKPLLLEGAAAGRMKIVKELTTRHSLAARRIVETELLPQWGDAVSRGDTAAAGRTLKAARLIVALRPVQNERVLQTVIEEIDSVRDAKPLAAAWRAYGQGYTALDEGRNDEALALFADSLKLAGSRSPTFEAIVAPAVITAHYRRYEYAAAEVLITRTRARYEDRLDAFATLAARLDWIEGLILIARGDPSGALSSYRRALIVYEHLGEADHQAAQHVNQADSYAYLGDTERTGIHLRKALERASHAENPKRLYGILKVGANYLLDTGGAEGAVALQNRVVRITREAGDPLWLADSLVSRSSTLTRAGRREDGLRDIAEARRLMPQVVDIPSRRRLQVGASVAEAFAYRDVDDRRVVSSLSTAIGLARTLEMRTFLAQFLLERGRAYMRVGELDAAERDFRAGIDELEAQRIVVDDPSLRISFLDAADRVFVDLAVLLLSHGRVAEAFDFLERSRARELLDRASGRPMQPMRLQDIQSRLARDTIIITHTLTASSLITFVVTHGGTRAYEQTVDPKRIAALISQRAYRELGSLLVDGARLPAGGRVIFIPDRALHAVPLAALKMASGRYLVEEQTIAVAPSATLVVRAAHERRDAPPSALILASPQRPEGYDLPALLHVNDEARRVAAKYGRTRVIDGADPDAGNLLSISRAYEVLHFAGHSIVDARTPSRSALLVGRGGRITGAHIEAADLSHLQLVVLGGCNTALGKSDRSEGVMSLARSFLVANVPVVVGTVAPIEDGGAKRFLEEFHVAYARSGDAAAALREAQLRMLRSADANNAAPEYWSDFQVICGATSNHAGDRRREIGR